MDYDNNDNGWDIGLDDVERNLKGSSGFKKTIYNMIRSYKIFNLIIFLIIATFFVHTMITTDHTDPNPRTSLASVSPEEFDALNTKYTNEFFELVKSGSSDYRLIDKLIKSGVYIDTQDDEGKTALFYAVINRDNKMVRHLLKKGADVMAEDNDGLKPVDYIDKVKDRKVYVQLLDAKIQQKAREDGSGRVNIVHKFDNQGNMLSTTLNGKPYHDK